MEDGFDDTSSFALMTLDERLIELVRSHKILYNKHCVGYKGLEAKKEAWNAIGEQLETTADECVKRWTSLRERYSRELRKLEKHSESNKHVVIDWPYFSSLSFLREFVKPRGPRNTSNDTLSWNSPAPLKKFKSFSPESNEFSDASNPLEDICIQKVEMPIEIQNAVQSFGQTVAAILSEMSEAKQARAMRVLFNALISIKTAPEET